MAQKVQVLLLDDLDGSEAAECVSFGLDGAHYEIDLNASNAGKLRHSLQPYLLKARKTTARQGGGRAVTATRVSGSQRQGGEARREEREWLMAHGYADRVRERGRIPADLHQAFMEKRPRLSDASTVTPIQFTAPAEQSGKEDMPDPKPGTARKSRKSAASA